MSIKVKVVQEWCEDGDSKTGWAGNDWKHLDGTDIPIDANVIYDDPEDDDCQSDKFGHPIMGYYLI